MKLNKKLFNSLDAVVIIFFVVIFAVLSVKSLTAVSWGTENITATLVAEKVADGIIPEISAGDKIYTADGQLIGTVKSVYRTQATETYADTRVDSDLRWPLISVDVPDHSRLEFTLEIEAELGKRGYSVNGVSVKINRETEFCINGFSANGYFSSITEAQTNEE